MDRLQASYGGKVSRAGITRTCKKYRTEPSMAMTPMIVLGKQVRVEVSKSGVYTGTVFVQGVRHTSTSKAVRDLRTAMEQIIRKFRCAYVPCNPNARRVLRNKA